MQHKAFTHKLHLFNARWNDLPRRAFVCALTLLALLAALWLLPYIAPFALAYAFSLMLKKPVALLSRRMGRIRLGRRAATLVCMLLFFGVAGAVAGLIVTRIVQELIALVRAVPQAASWLTDELLPALRSWYEAHREGLPAWLPALLSDAVSTLSRQALSWAGTLSAAITSGAWSTAATLPHAFLAIALTVMGTYYFTADRERIAGFVGQMLPEAAHRHGRALRGELLRALGLQVKSELMVSAVITVFLMLGFLLFRVRYGLAIGLIIGIADALPVIGAGLFLIPWSVIGFLSGNAPTGFFMAGMYVGAIIIRQVIEPRIVGKHLGIYPLATMMAMYAGYRAVGIVGLIGGPLLLHVLRAVARRA